ncbi:MAG: hypothetical protein VB137_04120 [Burkholderia sp.]
MKIINFIKAVKELASELALLLVVYPWIGEHALSLIHVAGRSNTVLTFLLNMIAGMVAIVAIGWPLAFVAALIEREHAICRGDAP